MHSSETPPSRGTVPPELLRQLDGFRRPVLIGHVVPDADCVGSMFAMARAFTVDGCAPTVSLPDGSLAQRLSFLRERSEVRIADSGDFERADGFVVLDTAKKPRCNVEKNLGDSWADGRPLINIDHHSSNTAFGTLDWIVPDASSTSELVYRLLRAWGRPISPWSASLLFAGIHSDTGGFSLAPTSSGALSAAAELVALGANVAEIGERLCRSQRLSEFKLLRCVYANTRVVAGGRIAYSTASHEEIVGAGCTAADIDDQVSVPRCLHGVRLAMLFSEGVQGKTRINFRGEPGIPVLELAAVFGGGGHAESAGAVVTGGLTDVVAKVLPLAEEHLDRLEEGRG